MKPDLASSNQVFCSGLAGVGGTKTITPACSLAGASGAVTREHPRNRTEVPAFRWVFNSSCIRDFLLLYRDQAVQENNVWAEAHLNGLLQKVVTFENRARLQVQQELSTGSNTPVPSAFGGVKINIKQ